MPKCTELYERNGSIRIRVVDEGPGIKSEDKLTLFQEGVQLNANQLQSGQGVYCIFYSILLFYYFYF